MSIEEYSWHAQGWQLAQAAIARGAHALLIAGPRGVGKRDFALQLAASRLCERRAARDLRCASCESCRWLLAGTHPDFVLMEPIEGEPESDGATKQSPSARERPINVEQIRALGEALGLTSHRTRGKVVIIHPAEAMNLAACNALLKNLEEPPSPTLFILVSHRPSLLPPTVRSRCQQVHIKVTDAAAQRWLAAQGVEDSALHLALSAGAPLEALEASKDPLQSRRPELLRDLSAQGADGVALAERFRDVPPSAMLSWLQKWTFDVLHMQYVGRSRYHVDLSELASKLAGAVDARALSRLHRRLLGQQRHIHHPLNPRLLIEQLLIDCRQVLAGSRGRAE